MRVVSQDGTIDVSYENGSLVICACKSEDVKGAGVYYHDSSSPRGTKLAEYSRKTKAIKAMEMLREAYAGKIVFQNVEISDDKVIETLKNWKMQAITVANSDTTRVDCINNTVFQFPKDEDVEVEDET